MRSWSRVHVIGQESGGFVALLGLGPFQQLFSGGLHRTDLPHQAGLSPVDNADGRVLKPDHEV